MPLIPVLTLLVATAGAGGPALEVHNCDFGETYAFAIPQCQGRIDNLGGEAVRLRIAPAPPNDTVAPITVTVPAKRSVEVPLRAAIGNRTGKTINYFSVAPESGTGKPVYIEAHGFAMSALDQVRPSIDFGVVDTGRVPAASQDLTLESHDTADFRIVRVIDKPGQLKVSITPDRRGIQATVRRDADWGVLHGIIKLAIDTPHQKEAWVAVNGSIHGPIAPEANPVSLGMLSSGREQMLQITALRSGDGKPFRVGALKVEGIAGTAETAACTPVEEGCKVLRLKISDKQGPGMVRGRVVVDLPDSGKPLPIEFQGFLVGPEGLERDAPDAVGVQPPAQDSKAHEVPVQARNASGAGDSAPPPGTGPLLKWSVKDERVVYGYQVFRAGSAEGPFVLLNVPAIPAKGSSESGSSYQWRDTSATPGKTYWYYVGVVYNDGRKEKITPEMKALAK